MADEQTVSTEEQVASSESAEALVEQTPAQSNRPLCMECEQPIPPYENVPAGYVSPLSDEWKWKNVGVAGIPGVENLPKVVCQECFRKDFAKKYPNAECQV